ncbi:MAG: MFS transporter [Thermomicrobiales bacterium]
MSRWRRTLYTIFATQVLTLIGFSCVFPFFPLYIQTLGIAGPAVILWSGVITFSGSFTLAVASPIWGALADRYGRKPMLIRAMTGGAVVTALLIVAPNIWVVLILRVLQGTLTGTVAPARALVAAVTPREELGFSMGLMEASIFLGSAVGPFAGGFLNDRLGFHGTFAVGSSLLAISAILVLFLIDEQFTPAASAGHHTLNPVVNLRQTALMPGLAILALVLFGANFANSVPSPVLPLLIPELHGVPVIGGVPQVGTAVGLVLAVAGLCATAAAWRTRLLTNRFGYRRTLIGALIVAGAFTVPAAFVGTVFQMLVVRAAVGLCIGAALPTVSALVSLITPRGQQGSAYGLLASAELIGFALGPLVGGVIGASLGLRATFLVPAAVLILVAMLVLTRVHIPPTAEIISVPHGAEPLAEEEVTPAT